MRWALAPTSPTPPSEVKYGVSWDIRRIVGGAETIVNFEGLQEAGGLAAYAREEAVADFLQEGVEEVDGQSEHVLVAAHVARNEQAAGSVNGVGASAIKWSDGFHEAMNVVLRQGAEGDGGALDSLGLLPC